MNSNMSVRRCEASDAEAMLRLAGRFDEETQAMLFEPGEWKTTIEEQEKLLEGFAVCNDERMTPLSDRRDIWGMTT